MLSPTEVKFLEALIKGDISDYEGNYPKVLKSRILRKWADMSEDMILISSALEKLHKI